MVSKKQEKKETITNSTPPKASNRGNSHHKGADLVKTVQLLETAKTELQVQNEELRWVQDQFRDLRSRYLDLYDSAPAAFFTVDLSNGRTLEANLTASDFLKATREEILRHRFSFFFDQDDSDAFYRYARKALEDPYHNDGEIKIRRTDGTSFGALMHIQGEPGSKVVRIAVTDITDRKKAEEALKKNEEQLKFVLENSTDAAYQRNIQTDRYDYLSPVFERITGFTVAEMNKFTADEVATLIHPDDVSVVTRELGLIARGEKESGFVEYRFRARQGEYRWLADHFKLMRDERGRPIYRIGIIRDITVHKQISLELERYRRHLEELVAERTAELKASEEKFRSLVENVPIGIAMTTSEGKPIFRNKALAEQSGYEPEEPGEIPVIEHYFDPKDREKFLRLARKGQVRNFEARQKLRNGSVRWVSLSTIPLKTEHGDAMITIVEDITERKKAEEQRKTFPARLLDAQEKERRLISRELHDETGQYLTALKLMLQHARRQSPDEMAKTVEEVSVLTNELWAQLKEFSLNLRHPMLDELGLLPSLLWHFERLGTQTGLEVTFIHSGLENKLLQTINYAAFRIIQEALTNVAKYAGVREAEVRVESDGKRLLIQITDRGRGFDVAEALSRPTLGLSNMRERAELLGGTYEISSAPGAGTTVTAEIPLPGENG